MRNIDEAVANGAVDEKIGDLPSIDDGDQNLIPIFNAQSIQSDFAVAIELENAAHCSVGGRVGIDFHNIEFGNRGDFPHINHFSRTEKLDLRCEVGAVAFVGLRVEADGNLWLLFCETKKGAGENGEEKQTGDAGKFHT